MKEGIQPRISSFCCDLLVFDSFLEEGTCEAGGRCSFELEFSFVSTKPKTAGPKPAFCVIRRSRKSERSSHISIYASVDGRSAPSGKRWTMDQVERWTRFYFLPNSIT
jgi:hypothetical protein